jgi:hypothetical protein
MKNWTLESPGAGLVLHLVLFTLVVAAVRYSEHRAAPPPPPSGATPSLAAPAPGLAGHTAPHAAVRPVPVAHAAAQRHPTP